MKNILIPTDFSDNAWGAVFTAIKLFEDVECIFYLLHAYEPGMFSPRGNKKQQELAETYDSLAQYSEQELQKVLAYLGKHHQNPNHRFEVISQSDTLVSSVKKIISKQDIDLTVMGTQGASGAKEVFLGSNTVKAMKKILKCPLLVVPESFNFQHLKTIVFPTDFSKTYEKFQLLPLIKLALLWKAKILVLYVSLEHSLKEKQKDNKKLLEERLYGLEVKFRDVDYESNIARTIEKFIAENDTQLMALVRYKHSFWERILREPVVKRITFHTEVPLLVLPE